ncbi:hypothetical protein [Sporocytophaga myxococcoides]|nr:hypothetical protein [Sporocytophaga myxococcoides]
MNLKKAHSLAILLIFMTFAISSKGQESFNKISVSSGLVGSTLKDRVISSYVYKKKSIPVTGEYSYKGYNSFLGARLYFLSSKLKTDENKGFSYSGDLGTFIPDQVKGLTQSQVKFMMFQTRVYYLGRIHFDDRFSLGLGGFAQFDVINKKFLVLDYENKLKDRFLSVGPQIMPVYISGQHEFQYALSASIFNTASRKLTPEEGEATKVSGASLFKNYFGLESRLTYSYSISQNIGFDINYIFYYYQYKEPRKEQMVIQSLTLGLAIMF